MSVDLPTPFLPSTAKTWLFRFQCLGELLDLVDKCREGLSLLLLEGFRVASLLIFSGRIKHHLIVSIHGCLHLVTLLRSLFLPLLSLLLPLFLGLLPIRTFLLSLLLPLLLGLPPILTVLLSN